MTPLRRLGLPTGAALGVVTLGLLAGFAVLLPEATGSDGEAAGATGSVDLPDTLPGGWSAVDLPSAADDDSGGVGTAELRERATDYVREVYAEVYDDPVAFRAYADEAFEDIVVVTVFTSDGGAFGPPNGLGDPEVQQLERATTELVREGEVVCVANYQAVAAGTDGPDGADVPLGVSCQLPVDGRTVQLATTGQSVDDTVALVHDVEDAIG